MTVGAASANERLLAKKVPGDSATCESDAFRAPTWSFVFAAFADVMQVSEASQGPTAARHNDGNGLFPRTGKNFVLPVTANQPAPCPCQPRSFAKQNAKRSGAGLTRACEGLAWIS